MSKRTLLLLVAIMVAVGGFFLMAYRSSEDSKREFWDQMYTNCMGLEGFATDLGSAMFDNGPRTVPPEAMEKCRDEANEKAGTRP